MRSGSPAQNLRKRKFAEVEWMDQQPSQQSKRRQLEVSDLLEYLERDNDVVINQPKETK